MPKSARSATASGKSQEDRQIGAGHVSNNEIASTTEELRNKILIELRRLELQPANTSKSVNRSLHAPAVQVQLAQSQKWIQRKYPKYATYFADGREIDPLQINPTLIDVTETWQADLFQLARLTW